MSTTAATSPNARTRANPPLSLTNRRKRGEIVGDLRLHSQTSKLRLYELPVSAGLEKQNSLRVEAHLRARVQRKRTRPVPPATPKVRDRFNRVLDFGSRSGLCVLRHPCGI